MVMPQLAASQWAQDFIAPLQRQPPRTSKREIFFSR
jgi:hypothetical protein